MSEEKKILEHKEPGTMKMLATLFQTFILKKKINNTVFENFIELIKYLPSTVVETKNV